MKHFKNKTIALVLASLVTVVGAFGADNYKNTLVSLKFHNYGGNTLYMTLFTKEQYAEKVAPVRKDACTYFIILPETTSEMPYMPSVDNGNVQSVNVSTLPYSNSNKGYTKITIKTKSPMNLNARASIYVPETKPQVLIEDKQKEETPKQETQDIEQDITPAPAVETVLPKNEPKKIETYNEPEPEPEEADVEPVSSNTVSEPEEKYNENDTTSGKIDVSQYKNYRKNDGSPRERLIFFFAFVLILFLVGFIYLQSREQMASVVGESDFDIDDKKEKNGKDKHKDKKRTSAKKIRSTINSLDKQYPFKNSMTRINSKPADEENTSKIFENEEEVINVVDIDSIYNSQKQADADTQKIKPENQENIEYTENQSKEYDDLAEFLDEFSFSDEIEESAKQEALPEKLYDEDLYNKCVTNPNIKFSKGDISKIQQLLKSELTNEVMDNLNDYVKGKNGKPPRLSKTAILENLIASYTVMQNISFSKDDVDAIKKLMNVELDSDFITDLRTNPERVKTMQKELEQKNIKSHKTSELLILNVKDMLPDLSKELKKQGNKPIESNAKPDVVYFSEGYEVSKLKLSSELPDLTKALKIKHNADNEYRPSDELDLAVAGYDVKELSVSNFLPDLNDVKAHPKKYEDKPKLKTQKLDEKALLESLAHVEFRPFYQEENSDKKEETNSTEPEKATEPKENKTLSKEDTIAEKTLEEIKDSAVQTPEEKTKEPIIQNKIQIKRALIPKKNPPTNQKTQELLSKIENQKIEVEKKKRLLERKPEENRTQAAAQQEKKQATVNVEGEVYNVIKNIVFGEKAGCYFVQNALGYAIIGYKNDKKFVLKKYTDLNTQIIQARINDKKPDGTIQYLVKISNHKIIINSKDDNMEFVMDLC